MKTRKINSPPSSVYEKQIRDIMDNFDFDYVQQFMSWEKSYREYDENNQVISEHPWKVHIKSGKFEVPSTQELKDFAKCLLESCVYSNNTSVACGPFKVTCNNGTLLLECIIEHYGDIY